MTTVVTTAAKKTNPPNIPRAIMAPKTELNFFKNDYLLTIF